LLNYLLAKKLSGHFMLRIDDTDIERSNLIYEEQIKKDLVWAGINWDSEVKQSQRINKYKEVLDLLISKQLVYPCFEDPEELNLKRKAQLSSGKPPIYDRKSLNLTDKEIEEKISNGKKPHYRFFLKSEKIIWNDLVRGECVLDTSSVSDPIIVREDGRFIYTLASVIDDSDFKITHIIRGEDHVTNSAVQIFKSSNVKIKSTKKKIIWPIDRTQWIRVLTNLIQNAIQAVPENRTPKINLDILLEKNKLKMNIEDNGTGIVKKDQLKIFEPKFTTKSAGMGLGLAIVKNIIDSLNGSISFKSEPNKGTKFSIILKK